MSVIFVLCRAFLCVEAISVLADIKHFWMLKESKIKLGLGRRGEARRGLMNLRQKKFGPFVYCHKNGEKLSSFLPEVAGKK